ncbi:MAG: DUF1616 domain-containing protein [Halohasta sp.]
MVAVVVAVVAIVACYYLVPTRPVRLLVSVPLLLFLPGYVIVGILFPRGSPSPRENGSTAAEAAPGDGRWLARIRTPDRVTITERLAVSFGLSVAILPLLGFLLEVLPVAAFDGAIFPTLVGGVTVGALIASVRRLRTPTDERFRIPLSAIGASVRAPLSGRMSWAERLATIALAATVLLAVVSVGYVFAMPQGGEQFTDLRVMTESDDGELTFGGYPDEITVGEETELVVGIDNREGERQSYTVVVTAEQLIEDDESTQAIEETELDRFETTVDDGQRRIQPLTVTPESASEVRINYYLYEGEGPSDPDADSAYRHVHFTTTAVDGGGAEGDSGDGEFEIDGSVDSEAGDTEEIAREPPSMTGDS